MPLDVAAAAAATLAETAVAAAAAARAGVAFAPAAASSASAAGPAGVLYACLGLLARASEAPCFVGATLVALAPAAPARMESGPRQRGASGRGY